MTRRPCKWLMHGKIHGWTWWNPVSLQLILPYCVMFIFVLTVLGRCWFFKVAVWSAVKLDIVFSYNVLPSFIPLQDLWHCVTVSLFCTYTAHSKYVHTYCTHCPSKWTGRPVQQRGSVMCLCLFLYRGLYILQWWGLQRESLHHRKRLHLPTLGLPETSQPWLQPQRVRLQNINLSVNHKQDLMIFNKRILEMKHIF